MGAGKDASATGARWVIGKLRNEGQDQARTPSLGQPRT
ncbi:hypothetical protein AKL17_1p0053 (plasmid) [Frigidibacter mobilis]|uniref:Uncharacterized protein n=1 Tax=Frigidibacter mobilis TaxID=1335048 RepID=A0A159ZB23_9RHOB|nr:hypothetical protein AKL17_1p0053 [Frigidibacter mobilis]